ncbi:hypothetical protein L3i20_v246270 [Paenibacillus sp. L3-i20]|nr:hypothetical protein L3i20_v246270 [Paenibacillus sp. L3-i20]
MYDISLTIDEIIIRFINIIIGRDTHCSYSMKEDLINYGLDSLKVVAIIVK